MKFWHKQFVQFILRHGVLIINGGKNLHPTQLYRLAYVK